MVIGFIAVIVIVIAGVVTFVTLYAIDTQKQLDDYKWRHRVRDGDYKNTETDVTDVKELDKKVTALIDAHFKTSPIGKVFKLANGDVVCVLGNRGWDPCRFDAVGFVGARCVSKVDLVAATVVPEGSSEWKAFQALTWYPVKSKKK